MPKWTEEQTQAIYKKGKNIIQEYGKGGEWECTNTRKEKANLKK